MDLCVRVRAYECIALRPTTNSRLHFCENNFKNTFMCTHTSRNRVYRINIPHSGEQTIRDRNQVNFTFSIWNQMRLPVVAWLLCTTLCPCTSEWNFSVYIFLSRNVDWCRTWWKCASVSNTGKRQRMNFIASAVLNDFCHKSKKSTSHQIVTELLNDFDLNCSFAKFIARIIFHTFCIDSIAIHSITSTLTKTIKNSICLSNISLVH